MTDHKKPFPSNETRWYPVRYITFAAATSVPGASGRTELRGDIAQKNVARWTIEYAPSMRHHKITFHSTDGRQEQIVMVPECNVRTWEPMP